ncbi:hypothetical protein Tco_1128892 [Tanacetum coccineum]
MTQSHLSNSSKVPYQKTHQFSTTSFHQIHLHVDDDSEHEADDMGFDPSDIAFTEWLGSKGDDEVELTDEEFFDNEDEIAEGFRIDC